MFVNGKAIAATIVDDVRKQVEQLTHSPVLSIVTCAPTQATKQYLTLKERGARSVGITVQRISVPVTEHTKDVIRRVQEATNVSDAVIVQLPLPKHIDTEMVLRAVPVEQDVDALAPNNEVYRSPVVEACREILERHSVRVHGEPIAVVGYGRLVGEPVAKWLASQGGRVTVVTEETLNPEAVIKNATIVVLGVGRTGMITPEQLRPGAVILDAGASEQGGKIRGDADPACATIASLFTPVPGGIGPITVAALLRNVVKAAQQNRGMG